MRIFSVAFVVLGLFFVAGCASSPLSTANRARARAHTPRAVAASRYFAALQFERRGKSEQAREIYQGLLNKNPRNTDYMHRLAVVCARLDRHAEATSLYERARRRNPRNAILVADMGYYNYVRGDLPEAERLLREALHLKPSYARATNNLALVVGIKGDFDESLSLFQQVGSEAEARSSLAYVHLRRGENKLAEDRYREALALDPKLKSAIVAIAELTKDKPEPDTFIAEVDASEMKPTRLAQADESDFAPSPVQKSVVQQASAIDTDASRKVVTANYVEERSDGYEPARLSGDDDELFAAATTEKRNRRAEETQLDDVDWDDITPSIDVSATSELTTSKAKVEADDWAK